MASWLGGFVLDSLWDLGSGFILSSNNANCAHECVSNESASLSKSSGLATLARPLTTVDFSDARDSPISRDAM
eukprot:4141925-Lingulodinium_polyedra.AAC.1